MKYIYPKGTLFSGIPKKTPGVPGSLFSGIPKIKNVVFAAMLTVMTGFTVTGCYDREIKTDVQVDQDRNLDGSTDTTIKRETRID